MKQKAPLHNSYPNVEYSLPDFLMDAFRIRKDWRTQGYMASILDFSNMIPRYFGRITHTKQRRAFFR